MGLNVRHKTIKLLEKSKGENLWHLGLKKTIPKALLMRGKINTLDFIKI